MNYEAELEKLQETFEDSVEVIRKLVQVQVINPLCDKYNVSFYSGMGTYGFETRHGRTISVTDYIEVRYRESKVVKAIKEIIPILELKGHPGDNCPIGAYMTDYPRSFEGSQYKRGVRRW